MPSFGISLAETRGRIQGEVSITPRSTVVLDGDITLGDVTVDGALIVRAANGAKVHIKNLTVKNEGYVFRVVDPSNKKYALRYQIRGYVLEKGQAMELSYPQAGTYIVDDQS